MRLLRIARDSRPAWRSGLDVAFASAAALLLVLACTEANPLPSPAGDAGGGWTPPEIHNGVDEPTERSARLMGALTYVSALGPEESEFSVVVVGAPEAAPPEARLRLSTDALLEPIRLVADARGGFGALVPDVSSDLPIEIALLEVDAETGAEVVAETLELRVRQLSGTEDDVPWAVPPGDEDAGMNGEPTAGGEYPGWFDSDGAESEALTVGAPDADGVALVSGGAGSVTGFSVVMVFHVRTGRSFVTQASNDGSFEIEVDAAEVDDELRVFAANPADSSGTTQDIVLVVPAP